jgi:hypothetical protein
MNTRIGPLFKSPGVIRMGQLGMVRGGIQADGSLTTVHTSSSLGALDADAHAAQPSTTRIIRVIGDLRTAGSGRQQRSLEQREHLCEVAVQRGSRLSLRQPQTRSLRSGAHPLVARLAVNGSVRQPPGRFERGDANGYAVVKNRIPHG